MILNPTQKAQLIKLCPELREYFDKQDTNEILRGLSSQPKLPPEFLAKIKAIKGDRGDKGDKGDSFIGSKGDKGDPGVQGIKGDKGDPGKDGQDGVKGQDGKDGRDGLNGKDAVVDVNIINKKIDDGMSRVDGRIKLIDQRFHGGGLSKVVTDSTLTGNGTGSSPLSVVGGGSGTVTSVTSADGNATVATTTSTPVITIVSAPKLQTARTIAGKSFDGTANITIASTDLSDTASITLLTSTQTLTNKRVTKRVTALSANSATPTINTDNCDVVHITAQSAAITSFTTNLSGTPVDGDTLRISVTGTTSIALTFGTSFEASTVSLPTTSSSTTRLDMGFLWNTETSKWRIVAVA